MEGEQFLGREGGLPEGMGARTAGCGGGEGRGGFAALVGDIVGRRGEREGGAFFGECGEGGGRGCGWWRGHFLIWGEE